ncbi:MAG: enoyl-CoA hydratase [Sneathiella sp.]
MTKFVTTIRDKTENGIVCHVSIDNQKKLNTLNSQIIKELKDCFIALKEEKEIAVVILTGAGDKSFIGGANINEMAGLDVDTARTFITNLHLLCAAIRDTPFPVIARVNGYCLGAGMEIASICDIIVATETAQFSMPEVRVGIPSVIEAAVLPQILGVGLARDLLLTGRTMYCDEAYRVGFVQRLAKEGELDAIVGSVVSDILASGRVAIKLQKELCNAWENVSVAHGVQLGIDAFAKAFETDEPTRMLGEFVNRKR